MVPPKRKKVFPGLDTHTHTHTQISDLGYTLANSILITLLYRIPWAESNSKVLCYSHLQIHFSEHISLNKLSYGVPLFKAVGDNCFLVPHSASPFSHNSSPDNSIRPLGLHEA